MNTIQAKGKGIGVYQMKLFVTVVDQQSISRAAALLGLEEPYLTRQIVDIETNINIPLLDRGAQPLRPTSVGKLLYQDWKYLTDYFDNSLTQARSSLSKTRSFSMCVIDSITLLRDLPAIRAKIAEHLPNSGINFEYVSFNQWREMLLQDKTDLVLTMAFDTGDLDDTFQCVPIAKVPKLVCMLRSNPLSKKECISFSDLLDQRIICLSNEVFPQKTNYLCQMFLDHTGAEPDSFRYVSNANATIGSLAEDNEVAICDCFLRDFDNPLVKAFELPDVTNSLCAVWKAENEYIDPIVEDIRSAYL